MASIKERGGKYCVIYSYKDEEGVRRQRWETFDTKAEAKKRKKEIEYRIENGSFFVPQCKILADLLEEYVHLYGKDKWSLSTYSHNNGLIANYILPLIGESKLDDINTHFLEKYYQKLLQTRPVDNPISGKPKGEFVTTSTIRDIHKLLRSCFEQAVKWELMERNPAMRATVPKYVPKKREIWTAQTLMYAMDVCEDDILKLAMNLAFAASMRIGEILGLTWDCVDISPEAIEKGSAYLYINKEVQRVTDAAVKELDEKDILLIFPKENALCTSVRVLKMPKTSSSVRKVFLPASVARMLAEWKEQQDEIKSILGPEYQDYDLVLSTVNGMPYSAAALRKKFQKLIDDHDLPKVVFHSLRHSSVTYKLKLNGGDIKAVQGDSGHAQVNMVTDVYSHILDDDRKKNAMLFEDAFYARKDLEPKIHEENGNKVMQVPEGVDADLLAKVLTNPEMAALLTSMAKALEGRA